MSRPIVAAALAGMLTVVVGCSVAEPGAAVKAPGGPPAGTVDVPLLSTGNFPTDPAPPMGQAGSAAQGALVDARRMANNVVGPWEVDPALVTPSPVRAAVLNDPAGVGLIEPAGVASAVAAHNFINGFASDRQSQPEERLMNAVLRFYDPRAAAGAAADMAGRAAQQSSPPSRPLPIPRHPDALATTVSYSMDGPQQTDTVYSFTPHGPYVLCQIANAPQIDAAAALVAGTLDLQGPLIDKFGPTDPAKFTELPLDPSGLLAHTMPTPTWPEPKDTAPTNPKVGLYTASAALHFQDDPLSVGAAFSAAGMQVMSYNHLIVYQTRDPAAAAQLAIDLADSVAKSQLSTEPINNVDFMPTSRCVQSMRPDTSTKPRYYCFAPIDSFTIEVHAADPTAARQQTAAQYKMLLAH